MLCCAQPASSMYRFVTVCIPFVTVCCHGVTACNLFVIITYLVGKRNPPLRQRGVNWAINGLFSGKSSVFIVSFAQNPLQSVLIFQQNRQAPSAKFTLGSERLLMPLKCPRQRPFRTVQEISGRCLALSEQIFLEVMTSVHVHFYSHYQMAHSVSKPATTLQLQLLISYQSLCESSMRSLWQRVA